MENKVVFIIIIRLVKSIPNDSQVIKCWVKTADGHLFKISKSSNYVFYFLQDVSLPTSTSTSIEAGPADEYVAIPENIREFMTEVRLSN